MDQAQARRGRKEQSTDTEKSRHAQDETRKKEFTERPCLEGDARNPAAHHTHNILALFFNFA